MSLSHSQVGFLVPLNQNLEEDPSVPKLPVSNGTNVIGRNNIPVPDKRLSRKHLTLTASPNGSANLLVEGTNPIVVNSRNKRRKLNSQEKVAICDGDIIELIPGHHLFKYEVLGDNKNGSSLITREASSSGRKKEAQVSYGNEPSNGLFQERGKNAVAHKPGQSQSSEDSKAEATIRNFRLPNDKIPSTFRLLRVQGLPPWANTSCVSIDDVIQGDILIAILSNYMVDIDWLVPACPALSKVPHVLVIHGESDGRVDCMKRSKPANWILHKPPLPISYGTHHSKAMLLVYPQGIRVIVHTANLIYVDWNNKSQGLWMQDFPWKNQNSLSKASGFEHDLVEYLSTLKVQRGKTFSIEVGYFDSVLEIKEKVHKYHGIPVSKQTLILKGQSLQDNDDVLKCEIFHNSRIQLLVAPDTDKPPPPPLVKREDVPSPPPTKIHLNVKAVSSNNAHLPLEMDVNDSIMRLKEKIHEMEGVLVNRLILHARGNELHDHQLLRDCDVSDNSKIGASLRPLPPSGGGSNGGGSGNGSGGLKKLKMTVFAKNGTRKIPVEVNALDNVGELRKELHKLNQRMQFPLPQEGYFFIYNQNVMDDDKSFRWHHVGQGDIIEVFNGSVTGGS